MQGFTRDLFDGVSSDRSHEQLAPGAWLLHGFALERGAALVAAIDDISAAAPFRHLVTPGGFRMSAVAMTNCGSLEVGERPAVDTAMMRATRQAASLGRRCRRYF